MKTISCEEENRRNSCEHIISKGPWGRKGHFFLSRLMYWENNESLHTMSTSYWQPSWCFPNFPLGSMTWEYILENKLLIGKLVVGKKNNNPVLTILSHCRGLNCKEQMKEQRTYSHLIEQLRAFQHVALVRVLLLAAVIYPIVSTLPCPILSPPGLCLMSRALTDPHGHPTSR